MLAKVKQESVKAKGSGAANEGNDAWFSILVR